MASGRYVAGGRYGQIRSRGARYYQPGAPRKEKSSTFRLSHPRGGTGSLHKKHDQENDQDKSDKTYRYYLVGLFDILHDIAGEGIELLI